MKKILFIVTMVMACLSVNAQTWYEANVKGANAEVRNSMSSEYEVVKVILKGEKFYCTKINGGFWPVYATVGGSRLGYMEASKIETVKEVSADEQDVAQPDEWCGTYTCSGSNYTYILTIFNAGNGMYGGNVKKTLKGEKTSSEINAQLIDGQLVINGKGDGAETLTMSIDEMGMYQIQLPFLDYLVSIYKVN